MVLSTNMGNSAEQLRMPRICCLFSCWISSRSGHALNPANISIT